METAVWSPPVHSICGLELRRRGTRVCQVNLQALRWRWTQFIWGAPNQVLNCYLKTSSESLTFHLSNTTDSRYLQNWNEIKVLQESAASRMCFAHVPCFSQFESEPLTFILYSKSGLWEPEQSLRDHRKVSNVQLHFCCQLPYRLCGQASVNPPTRASQASHHNFQCWLPKVKLHSAAALARHSPTRTLLLSCPRTPHKLLVSLTKYYQPFCCPRAARAKCPYGSLITIRCNHPCISTADNAAHTNPPTVRDCLQGKAGFPPLM